MTSKVRIDMKNLKLYVEEIKIQTHNVKTLYLDLNKEVYS